jgi:parallel beta-helix repeat protein
VDLVGESDPVPVVRNCRFLGADDDAINPTRCSAILTGNFVSGCRNYGIVLRDRATPYLENNVVYGCGSGGIAIENQNDALLVNNTIVGCGKGLRLFQLNRAELSPGGGTGTAINCIIWDCPKPVVLEDGSTLTAEHCIIEGETVWPGNGNLNLDPRFLGEEDFRLHPESPAIDAGSPTRAPRTDHAGNHRPCGKGVDIGAFESGSCEAPNQSPGRENRK